MQDPVVASDGQSYERAAIEHWLREHTNSPATGAALRASSGRAVLLPNVALRKAIAAWRQQLPMALDPAWLELSDELLGEGAFGRVVGGVLTAGAGRPQPVAVKTFPALTQAEQRAQFERELEAHLVAQRGADGVCQVLGTCEKAGRVCVVMKRYERSVADVIRQGDGGVSTASLCRYARKLCQTLVQLHAAGVLLQDIKPENILLDSYDNPVSKQIPIKSCTNTATRTVQPYSHGLAIPTISQCK
jgi:hypothetical protein